MVTTMPSGHKMEYTYEGGERHGPFKWLYADGSTAMVGQYYRGELNGMVRQYYYGGSPKSSGVYDMGMKTGMWVCYHENGATRSMTKFKDGLKHGWYRAYGESGLLDMECQYERGQLHGEFRTVYQSSGKTWEKRTYHRGEQVTGMHYSEGDICTSYTEYENGVEHGAQRYFHREKGNLHIRAMNFNGRRVGLYKEYHPNGEKKLEGMSNELGKDGEWKEWDEDGNLVSVSVFKDGKFISKLEQAK